MMLRVVVVAEAVCLGVRAVSMWPRVYVYNLSAFWDEETFSMSDLEKVIPPTTRGHHTGVFLGKEDSRKIKSRLRREERLETLVYGGMPCRDSKYDEHLNGMFSVAKILLWRILRSDKYYEPDPSKADLFYVPLWPREKAVTMWNEVCRRPQNLELERYLPHLTEKTAHRHFIVVAKGHLAPCDKCDAWWRFPRGLLRRVMRFSYSSEYREQPGSHSYGPVTLDEERLADELEADIGSDDVQYPHLVSIPYSSSIHASSGPRFLKLHTTVNRSVLAAFVGSPHAKNATTGAGGKYATARSKILDECQADSRRCSNLFIHGKKNRLACGQIASEYANATFCLQPGGDSPYRKGLYDALLLGCIPVVLSLYNTRVAPMHFWPGYQRNSIVVLNETAYLQPGATTLLDQLAAIPLQRIQKMRAVIARNVHRLQYARRDYPDDAVDLLLKGAWHTARAREYLRDLYAPPSP